LSGLTTAHFSIFGGKINMWESILSVLLLVVGMGLLIKGADWFVEVELLESKIDDLTEDYRKNMFERLKASSCSADGSILYSTLLINLERIGDDLLNVSEKVREV
jgi:uncharacterized protein Yka (UPF0111/DUF47 family)